MHLQILGDIAISTRDGTAIALRPQTRRLLALLAIADGASVPAERIVEYVLDGNPERAALRKAMSRLRGVVGDLVERSGDGYLLRVGDLDVDSRRFEAARRGAASAAPADRVDLLTAALGLWRGRALTEFADEPWAAPTSARLETARSTASEDLAEALIENGRALDAIAMLERQIAAAPHAERPVSLLMRALADSGRVAEALRCYRQFYERLRDGTGLSPSIQLSTLELGLLSANDARRPASTPPSPIGNLVNPLATFVGRDTELATIAESVRARRLTTIKGVGGVGKTRLATEVGWSLVDDFPDGVWFVDLVPVSDEATIVHAIASVLGAGGEVGDSLLDAVIADLRDRRALLIVDNCEHVRLASVTVVSAIVTRCPELRVLATSRVPLGVAGEHVLSIGPLSEIDGIELFYERASDLDEAGSSDLEPSRPAVAEICQRLDGLPLAIELAAARTGSFSPAEIVARLDDRYQLLTAEGGRPARHQSMHDVIDWSYQLLDDRERHLFEAISIFPGSFDLAAVEAVCQVAVDGGAEYAASLASLVDTSMVVATRSSTGTRFHVLVTIGQFGRDRLDERDETGDDVRAQLRRAHMRHYARVAASVYSMWERHDQREAVALMTAEWDNFRAAFVAAVDDADNGMAAQLVIDLVPALLTLRPEHAEWVRTVFPMVRPPGGQAEALYTLAAYWAEALGEPDEVVVLVERGHRWWRKDPHLANVLARALLMLDRATEAMDAAQICLTWVAEHRATGSLSRLNAAHFVATASDCALIACPSETVELARLAADVAREVGGVDAQARAQLAAGIADLATGQPAAAVAAFRRTLDLGRGIGGLERAAWSYVAGASALAGHADADATFLDALRFLRRDRMWMHTFATLERLTIHWIDNGNIEAGSVLLGYLDAHGWGASVDASDRARARSRVTATVTADAGRKELLRRGAALDRNQLVEFALDELEAATSSSTLG